MAGKKQIKGNTLNIHLCWASEWSHDKEEPPL